MVENAFGIMSSVFRVLRKPMLLEPNIATKVVLATVYLHIFLRKMRINIYTPAGSLDSEVDGNFANGSWRHEEVGSSFLPLRAIPRRSANDAKSIRSHLATHFVTNGEIPWQCRY